MGNSRNSPAFFSQDSQLHYLAFTCCLQGRPFFSSRLLLFLKTSSGPLSSTFLLINRCYTCSIPLPRRHAPRRHFPTSNIVIIFSSLLRGYISPFNSRDVPFLSSCSGVINSTFTYFIRREFPSLEYLIVWPFFLLCHMCSVNQAKISTGRAYKKRLSFMSKVVTKRFTVSLFLDVRVF